MATNPFLAGFEHGRERGEQLRDEQRMNQLQTALSGATTQEEKNAILHDAYAKDPSKVKQFVENLGRRLVGKQPQQATSPYTSPSTTTTTGAVVNPETGETITEGKPLTVRGPSPKTKQEAFAGHAERGKTPEQRQLETFKAETEAQQSGDLAGKKRLSEWQAGFDREQVEKQVQSFADTYKRMTGKEPSSDLLEAFTVSSFGGDKVLSTMEQANALKSREEYQNATLQLKQAQQALNQAKFDASQNPNNPTFRLKLQQAATAAERANAMWVGAQARVFGSVGGVALPGAMVDEEGRSIGAEFQGNVRPTGTMRSRAELAVSARDQLADADAILRKRSGLFGPGKGQFTSLKQWIGTADPDARAYQAAVVTAADHLMGVFGGRSTYAGQRISELMDNFNQNPEATIAALRQYDKAAQKIQGLGSYSTVGGGAESPSGGKGAPAPKKTGTDSNADPLGVL